MWRIFILMVPILAIAGAVPSYLQGQAAAPAQPSRSADRADATTAERLDRQRQEEEQRRYRLAQERVLREKIRAEERLHYEQLKAAERARLAQLDTKPRVRSYGRKVVLPAGRHGHFYGTAKMNNKPVKFLVDTGASSVAINESTARRIGLRITKSDYRYTVDTANGKIKAAAASIKEIKVGRISVKNVDAAILPDAALSGTLLGMSFLSQLKSFKVNGDELTLIQ